MIRRKAFGNNINEEFTSLPLTRNLFNILSNKLFKNIQVGNNETFIVQLLKRQGVDVVGKYLSSSLPELQPQLNVWITAPPKPQPQELPNIVKGDFCFLSAVWEPTGIIVTPQTTAAPYGYTFPKRDYVTGEKINPPKGTVASSANEVFFNQCLINRYRNNRYLDHPNYISSVIPFPYELPQNARLRSSINSPLDYASNQFYAPEKRVGFGFYRTQPALFPFPTTNCEGGNFLNDIWCIRNAQYGLIPGLYYQRHYNYPVVPYDDRQDNSDQTLSIPIIRQYTSSILSKPLIFERPTINSLFVHYPEELLYENLVYETNYLEINKLRTEAEVPLLCRWVRGWGSVGYASANEIAFSKRAGHDDGLFRPFYQYSDIRILCNIGYFVPYIGPSENLLFPLHNLFDLSYIPDFRHGVQSAVKWVQENWKNSPGHYSAIVYNHTNLARSFLDIGAQHINDLQIFTLESLAQYNSLLPRNAFVVANNFAYIHRNNVGFNVWLTGGAQVSFINVEGRKSYLRFNTSYSSTHFLSYGSFARCSFKSYNFILFVDSQYANDCYRAYYIGGGLYFDNTTKISGLVLFTLSAYLSEKNNIFLQGFTWNSNMGVGAWPFVVSKNSNFVINLNTINNDNEFSIKYLPRYITPIFKALWYSNINDGQNNNFYFIIPVLETSNYVGKLTDEFYEENVFGGNCSEESDLYYYIPENERPSLDDLYDMHVYCDPRALESGYTLILPHTFYYLNIVYYDKFRTMHCATVCSPYCDSCQTIIFGSPNFELKTFPNKMCYFHRLLYQNPTEGYGNTNYKYHNNPSRLFYALYNPVKVNCSYLKDLDTFVFNVQPFYLQQYIENAFVYSIVRYSVYFLLFYLNPSFYLDPDILYDGFFGPCASPPIPSSCEPEPVSISNSSWCILDHYHLGEEWTRCTFDLHEEFINSMRQFLDQRFRIFTKCDIYESGGSFVSCYSRFPCFDGLYYLDMTYMFNYTYSKFNGPFIQYIWGGQLRKMYVNVDLLLYQSHVWIDPYGDTKPFFTGWPSQGVPFGHKNIIEFFFTETSKLPIIDYKIYGRVAPPLFDVIRRYYGPECWHSKTRSCFNSLYRCLGYNHKKYNYRFIVYCDMVNQYLIYGKCVLEQGSSDPEYRKYHDDFTNADTSAQLSFYLWDFKNNPEFLEDDAQATLLFSLPKMEYVIPYNIVDLFPCFHFIHNTNSPSGIDIDAPYGLTFASHYGNNWPIYSHDYLYRGAFYCGNYTYINVPVIRYYDNRAYLVPFIQTNCYLQYIMRKVGSGDNRYYTQSLIRNVESFVVNNKTFSIDQAYSFLPFYSKFPVAVFFGYPFSVKRDVGIVESEEDTEAGYFYTPHDLYRVQIPVLSSYDEFSDKTYYIDKSFSRTEDYFKVIHSAAFYNDLYIIEIRFIKFFDLESTNIDPVTGELLGDRYFFTNINGLESLLNIDGQIKSLHPIGVIYDD